MYLMLTTNPINTTVIITPIVIQMLNPKYDFFFSSVVVSALLGSVTGPVVDGNVKGVAKKFMLDIQQYITRHRASVGYAMGHDVSL